ncbi:unnamed protein product [Linum tenue]|uniref:Uncharacterized protein n=1 Tax=Linum tenue TaxID=586396 RepID=A0AAV0IMZ4_9ROSI|nr:unnamed protein product [Linum tenue]
MHGREGEERKRARHMWTDPTPANSVVEGDVSSSSPIPNSFYKDGRKICVGDCALFKPPEESPPFIGIIRCVITSKDNNPTLGVNWLYRPSEIKLGKSILLDAAPNEIFYSFHKDEISAASLLHPCKVSFLPKGAELPSGISSFVCHRVYDIRNKCLWWLTDQDYIDEHQEEVDQLLSKTRIEMHATVQSGGHSPKPMNGPNATSQSKPGSDGVQNSGSSFPSQVKGKKRERGERGDPGLEPLKRERSTKLDDGDSANSRAENTWKSEITKLKDKGGLVDFDAVEKLVQLMLPDRNEKKIDLVGRSIMAGIVAATDKFDCLNRFVQLRGLPVFDEWIQEAHKGKIGDGNSPKDGDKSVEEFLSVLLRALEKIPVDLHALQTCNIGKSVNQLRSHKNTEIQKKAKSLVDTWKKRVEAEMDAKSGSNQGVTWATRSRLPDASHGGSRHAGVVSEVALKSSTNQLSVLKAAPAKLVPGEAIPMSASGSPGSNKLTPVPVSGVGVVKEGQTRYGSGAGGSDASPTTARDEKSSSSSQSHNNSQTVSGDQTKTVGFSGKEDTRSSGSMTPTRVASGSSRHRKSSNGFLTQAGSVAQRETGTSRSSPLQRNPASEKFPQNSLASDKVADLPTPDATNHRFVVKIPNRGRSPAQSASGGSFEDPSAVHNRSCSPILSEKQDQLDHNLKDKNDACNANVGSDVNTESWQSNDFKDVLTGSDEAGGSPTTGPDDENSRAGEDTKKLPEVSKSTSLPASNENKSGKLHDASFSSMNALIESCVKYSDASTSMSGADDVGMNLLASVAAGEMSKPDVALQCDPLGDSRVQSHPGDTVIHGVQSRDNVGVVTEKKDSAVNTLETKTDGPSQEKDSTSCAVEAQQTGETCKEKEDKTNATLRGPFNDVPAVNGADKKLGGGKNPWKKDPSCTVKAEATSDDKEKSLASFSAETKLNVAAVEVKAGGVRSLSPHTAFDPEGENKKNSNEVLNFGVQTDQKPPAVMRSDSVKRTDIQVLNPSGQEMVSTKCQEEVKKEEVNETTGRNPSPDNPKTDQLSKKDEDQVKTEIDVPNEQESGSQDESGLQSDRRMGCRGSREKGTEADDTEESCSAAADASLAVTGSQDNETKMVFDLNEMLNGDDGKYIEPSNVKVASASSASIPLISPLPLQASLSSSLPASITVASAAKGPFVPPEDLLKSRGELGWRGSAATSAFRPAEPRKTVDPNVTGTTPNGPSPDASSAKPGRPLFDFDLNVADERVLEDFASRVSDQAMSSVTGLANNHHVVACDEPVVASVSVRSSAGLDLDLNKMDDDGDVGNNHLTSNGRRLDIHFQPTVKTSAAAGLISAADAGTRRDFDLNNGPLAEEVGTVEPSTSFVQQIRNNSIVSQSAIPASRVNSKELGNFASWFPPQGNYPGVATIQPMLPDRAGEQQPFSIVAPQRMVAAPAVTVSNTFSPPDVYRGPVLSSSPAVPFPSAPFQYSVFPFGNNFPLTSAAFSGGSTAYVDSASGGRLCFPAVPSQVLAPGGGGVLPSPYHPRPYVVSIPDASSSMSSESSSRKWGGRQGLDLNAGPLGGPDTAEGRDETTSSSLAASRQHQLSLANSHQALIEEQQSRIYHQVSGGGVLKRKEPDGGWDGYKHHPPWQ